MSQVRTIAACLFVLFLMGCSTANHKELEPERFQLLPPAEGPGAMLLKQRVTMEAWGQQRQFLAVMRLNDTRIQMVALLPTGQQLLSLDYDGKNLTQENLPSINIPGEDILALIQFALWPEHSVIQHYPKEEGWRLELGSQERTLLNTAGALLKVSYHENDLVLDNYLRDYRVNIHTLEKTDL